MSNPRWGGRAAEGTGFENRNDHAGESAASPDISQGYDSSNNPDAARLTAPLTELGELLANLDDDERQKVMQHVRELVGMSPAKRTAILSRTAAR